MLNYIHRFAAAAIAVVMLTGCGKRNSAADDIPQITTSASAITTVAETAESTTETKTEPETTAAETETTVFDDFSDDTHVEYHFRSKKHLEQHFAKHGEEFGSEFGYNSAADYESGASDVINDPDALFKLEAEDGDGVYYIEATNEFVILSKDGYIRTYFRPSAGKKYFDRQ